MFKKYLIWILIFLFGTIYSFYSVIRHLRLESFIFDLGVYDQIIWLAGKGKPLFSSILEAHPWGDHFTPTLLLLSPLYLIWNNVMALLIFQAFFAVFGAYPIYLLAKKKTKSSLLSLVLAFAYLSFYGIQNAIAFDFHPIVLATTLLAWIFWFYEEGLYKRFWITLALFLGLQENFFLLAGALGVFLILQYKDFKRGIFLVICSLSLFLLVTLVAIPFFGQAQFTYLPTHLKTISLAKAAKMFFTPFSKIQVMLTTPLAFGFLPFLSPAIWVVLFEEYLQRFVGTPIPTRWSLAYQYNAILAPITAFGAIQAIQRYFLKRRFLAISLILTGTFLIQFLTKPALNDLGSKKFYDFSKTKNAKEILSLLPQNASVAATNNLGPQITHRRQIIFLTNCINNPVVWKIDVKRCFGLKPEYIVADMDPGGNWNNWYPNSSREELSRYLEHVQKTEEYRIVKQAGYAVLLKRSQP